MKPPPPLPGSGPRSAERRRSEFVTALAAASRLRSSCKNGIYEPCRHPSPQRFVPTRRPVEALLRKRLSASSEMWIRLRCAHRAVSGGGVKGVCLCNRCLKKKKKKKEESKQAFDKVPLIEL